MAFSEELVCPQAVLFLFSSSVCASRVFNLLCEIFKTISSKSWVPMGANQPAAEPRHTQPNVRRVCEKQIESWEREHRRTLVSAGWSKARPLIKLRAQDCAAAWNNAKQRCWLDVARASERFINLGFFSSNSASPSVILGLVYFSSTLVTLQIERAC